MTRSSFFLGRGLSGNLRIANLTNQLPYLPAVVGKFEKRNFCRDSRHTRIIELLVLTGSYDRDSAHVSLALSSCARVALFETVPTPPDGPPVDVPERVWKYGHEIVTVGRDQNALRAATEGLERQAISG
jgi:hypothetical protein